MPLQQRLRPSSRYVGHLYLEKDLWHPALHRFALEGQHQVTYLDFFLTASPLPPTMLRDLVASPVFVLLVLLGTCQLGHSYSGGFQGVSRFLDWPHCPCTCFHLHLSHLSCEHFPPLLWLLAKFFPINQCTSMTFEDTPYLSTGVSNHLQPLLPLPPPPQVLGWFGPCHCQLQCTVAARSLVGVFSFL